MNLTITSGGAPLNLTGFTLAAQARQSASSPEVGIDAVVTVLNAAAGQIEVRWPGADVAALLDGAGKWTGVWDLSLKPSGSDPTTLVAGRFIAEMDVTRP